MSDGVNPAKQTITAEQLAEQDEFVREVNEAGKPARGVGHAALHQHLNDTAHDRVPETRLTSVLERLVRSHRVPPRIREYYEITHTAPTFLHWLCDFADRNTTFELQISPDFPEPPSLVLDPDGHTIVRVKPLDSEPGGEPGST